MRMGLAHTSARSFHGVAIKLATRGSYNHSLWWFENVGGMRVYYESYWRKDEDTGKTGVRGPVPWSDLTDWAARHPRTRKILVQDLPYDDQLCNLALRFSQAAVKEIRYPMSQLWQNFKNNVLCLGNPRWAISPKAWTCSEAAARVWAHIDPAAVIEHLRLGDILFDQVAPSGRRFGLMEAVNRFLDNERNAHTGG